MTCECIQQSSMNVVVWCDICKNDLIWEKEANPNRVYIKIDNFKIGQDIDKCFERIEELERMQKVHIERNLEMEKALHNYRKYKTCIEDLESDTMYLKQRIEKLELDYTSKRDNRHDLNQAISAIQRDYNERLQKIEHFFSGKIKNPVYEAIEAHVENFHKRIERIELNQLGKYLDPKVWVFVNERLDKLENKTILMVKFEEHVKQWKWVHEQITRLDILFQSNKTPHKCPVCEGNGMKFEPFLLVEGKSTYVNCISCEGKGILWG